MNKDEYINYIFCWGVSQFLGWQNTKNAWIKNPRAFSMGWMLL